MTSFAFIAGLIRWFLQLVLVHWVTEQSVPQRWAECFSEPFWRNHHPRTIFHFAKLAEKNILVNDEDENPLTEEIDHHTEKAGLYA